ncbi:FCD domain-containing protein [Kitasatospora sp. NPDC001603]|uniref:FCD domain-containing protein n=1 Tax=Kitasatospora sp. NPDC001603 TaxID=3154388 RepID=UPI00332CE97B
MPKPRRAVPAPTTARRNRLWRDRRPVLHNWKAVLEEHDTITAALRSGDPEAAERAARAHIGSQADHEVAEED